MKFGVISDLHCHTWSMFSTTAKSGINSRLEIILAEIKRAALEVKNAGSDLLIVNGDVFHTRGSIDPEVLNPVRETFQDVLNQGVSVLMIPGNHDLKSRDTQALSSAMENLNGLQSVNEDAVCHVFNAPTFHSWRGLRLAMVPWRDNYQDLINDIEALVAANPTEISEAYLFIHAGIDGVIPGMPDHGLTAAKLAAFGFKGVFAGHYHNYKDLGSGVYSVGALTHQNWGDVGTKAGFLMVNSDDNKVSYQATHAPQFIDVSDMDEEELVLNIPGNYVRYRGPHMTQSQIDDLRSEFNKLGAAGITIQVPRTAPSSRPSGASKGVLTIDQSVDVFIDARKDVPAGMDVEEIKRRSAQVLNDVRSVSEAD